MKLAVTIGAILIGVGGAVYTRNPPGDSHALFVWGALLVGAAVLVPLLYFVVHPLMVAGDRHRTRALTMADGGPIRKAALVIHQATWGVDGDPSRFTDTTAGVQAQLEAGDERTLNFTVDAASLFAHDPALNVVKTLWIKYRLDGKDYDERWQDGETVKIPPGKH